MEILNLTNTSEQNLHKIRNCDFSHHYDDIGDENLLQVTVNKLNENTEKIGFDTNTITQYDIIIIYMNSENQKIKRVTKIEKQNKVSRIPKRVIERRNLPKFGKALNSNDGVTMLGDEIQIEMVKDDGQSVNDINKKLRQMKEIKDNPGMKFSERRKLKEYQSNNYNITEPPKEPVSTKYTPPGKRDKKNNREKKYTVHISGFMPDFTKSELLDLIPRYLHVSKVTLPIFNNKCKGYGFVDVNNEQDMNRIIELLDKKPYKHMILHANCKK